MKFYAQGLIKRKERKEHELFNPEILFIIFSQQTFTCKNSTMETEKLCEIYPKVTIKTPQRRQ